MGDHSSLPKSWNGSLVIEGDSGLIRVFWGNITGFFGRNLRMTKLKTAVPSLGEYGQSVNTLRLDIMATVHSVKRVSQIPVK